MRDPFDPFADMRELFRSLDETRQILERADPLRSLREVQDQMRAYQPLLQSAEIGQIALPSLLACNFLAEANQLANIGDRMRDLLPDLSSSAVQIRNLLPGAEVSARLAEATTLARNWLQDLATGQHDLTRIAELQQHLRQGLLHPLPAAVEEFRRLAEGLVDVSSLQRSFSAQIAEVLSAVVRSASPKDLEEAIESAEKVLLDHAGKTPPSRLSREFWLAVLLTLLLFVLDQANGLRSSKDIIGYVQDVERRVLASIGATTPLEGTERERYWIVVEPLDVRAEPSGTSRNLGIIYPGRMALEMESREEWLRIEFLADSSAALSQGWVRRDGLQLLDEQE